LYTKAIPIRINVLAMALRTRYFRLASNSSDSVPYATRA